MTSPFGSLIRSHPRPNTPLHRQPPGSGVRDAGWPRYLAIMIPDNNYLESRVPKVKGGNGSEEEREGMRAGRLCYVSIGFWSFFLFFTLLLFILHYFLFLSILSYFISPILHYCISFLMHTPLRFVPPYTPILFLFFLPQPSSVFTILNQCRYFLEGFKDSHHRSSF